MLCPNCKGNLPDDAAFCGMCGCNIAQALSEQAAQPIEEAAQVVEEIVEQPEPAAEVIEDTMEQTTPQTETDAFTAAPDLGECTVDLSQYSPQFEEPIAQPEQGVQGAEMVPVVEEQTQIEPASQDVYQQGYSQDYQPMYYGQEMQTAPRENFFQKLTKKQKITFAAILAALVIAIAGVLIVLKVVFTPEKKLVDYLTEGKFDDALDYYSETYVEEDRDTDKLVEALNNRLETLKSDCGTGKITCDRAYEEISTIESMDIPEMDDSVYSAREYVDNVRMSEENYNEGNAYFESGEYESAIPYYQLVVDGTPYYDDAQEKLKQAVTSYKTDVFAEADGYAATEDYAQAIEILEAADEIVPEDEEITTKLDDYKKKYADKVCTDAIADADSKIAAENYSDAMRVIDQAIVEVGEDSRLTSKRTEIQTKYESYVITKADEYVSQNNYSGAFGIIDEALVLMPDNKKILDKREQIEATKPAGLNDIKVSESDHFEQVTDLVVTYDVVGETYSPGNLFIISAYDDGWGGGYSGYGKYYLAGSYTTMSGYISVADTSDVGECTLTVYGDEGKILYTSPVLSRSTSKIKVDIPVSGVQWIDIKLTVGGSNATMNVLLSEFYLYK